MRRRFTISSLVAAMVLSITALPAAGQTAGSVACPGGAPSAGFRDVPTGNAHSDAIDCGASLGLIEGRTSTEFDPGRSLTRGQIASLLARTLDQLDADLPSVDDAPDFSDIGAPHATSIRRLAAAGIVQGRADGSYDPNAPVRRDQLASLFVRALRFGLGDELVPTGRDHFRDISGGAHGANVDLAFELGIVLGKGDGRFAPLDATRRDQAASVVVRFADGLLEVLEAPFELTILHTNDGESALVPTDDDPGIARFLAALQAAQVAAETPVGTDVVRRQVTLFAGDATLPGPQLQAAHRSYDAGGDFYDALAYTWGGYDAMTVGNHEFDAGPDRFADFIEAASELQFISANLDVSAEDRLAALEEEGRLSASTTIRRAGRDIAVVGGTTEDLPTLTSPGGVVVTDLVEAVQDEVEAVRAAGAEIVIVSTHLQDINNELALVGELSGVDAVIGGGGGENLRDDETLTYPLIATDADGDEVPVVTVPGNYRDVGTLVLEFDGDEGAQIGSESELVAVPLDGPRLTRAVERIEEPLQAALAELAATVVATSEVDLDARRPSVRTRETNMGDLLADGLLRAARAQAPAFGQPQADVAVQNGGGIRNEAIVPAGELTVLDTFTTAPFGNFLAITTVDVEEFVAVLEHSVGALPAVDGRFGQWAGIEFRYDPTAAAGERIVEATIVSGDAPIEVVVGGVVQTDVRDIHVAGLNFTLNGGDGYPFPNPFTTLGMTDQEAFADMLSELGTVTAEAYPDLTIDEDRYRRFGPVGGTFVD